MGYCGQVWVMKAKKKIIGQKLRWKGTCIEAWNTKLRYCWSVWLNLVNATGWRWTNIECMLMVALVFVLVSPLDGNCIAKWKVITAVCYQFIAAKKIVKWIRMMYWYNEMFCCWKSRLCQPGSLITEHVNIRVLEAPWKDLENMKIIILLNSTPLPC